MRGYARVDRGPENQTSGALSTACFALVYMVSATGLKGLFQIREDIVDMFGTNGQTDGVGPNPLLAQCRFGELGMGRAGWMNHQGLHIRHVGQQGENLQMVDECLRLLGAAFDIEGENGGATPWEIALIERMMGMLRKAGVMNVCDLRMSGQIIDHL